MKRTLIILVAGLCALALSAGPAEQADSAYGRGDYARAAELYAAAGKEAPSADVYYNLGNCYFRLNRKAEAVLYYRRALKMDASAEDARYNLELVSSRLEDRFDERGEMFFVSALRDCADGRNARGWAWAGLWWMVLAVAGGLTCLLARRTGVRKIGFSVAMAGLLLSLTCDAFALYRRMAGRARSVVVMRTTDVWQSAETTGKKIRTLHEGTVLRLKEDFGHGMLRVEMPDGEAGFVAEKDVEHV